MAERILTMAITYDDISLLPQYSEIESRQNIDLSTNFTTNYKLKIPLIASPMDTVCDGEMAIAMAELGGVGIIHRFMSIEEQSGQIHLVQRKVSSMYNLDKYNKHVNGQYSNVPVAAAIGANGDYLERAQELTNAGANVILIDVAHGYHKFVKDALTKLKQSLPTHVDIIAGNVATAHGAQDLQDWGADAIRVGIGGGCFTPEMKVGTRTGMKPIVDVEIGDVVYTHTGEPKEVIHKFEYYRDEEIMVINGIECTKNHEFYVVHKRHADRVTEENIHEYAQWIAAEELTDDYFLIEL
jgi:IMP dehydrogenase/GMP reductase